MMRYGIPAYRLPRDVWAPRSTGSPRWGSVHRQPPGRGPRERAPRRRVRCRVRGRRRSPVQAGRHPGERRRHILDAVSFLRGVAAGSRPLIGRRVAVYGGGNTAMDAARVARRMGAEETLIVYRRPASRCRPTRKRPRTPSERACGSTGCGRSRRSRVRAADRGDGARRDGYPQPTGRFETLAADTVILAFGQETDTAFLRNVPGVEFDRDGTVRVSGSMMTGCPGVFAGGDMVPARADRDRRRRPRQAGRAGDRRLVARRCGQRAAQAPAGGVRRCCNLGTSAIARGASSRSWRRGATRRIRRGRRRSLDARKPVRGGPVSVVRQLLRVRRLPRRVPGGRGHQARAGLRYRFDYDRCTGCRAVSSSARSTRSRWSRSAPDPLPLPHGPMRCGPRSTATKPRHRSPTGERSLRIYPITPSSPMGEFADQWSAGRTEHLGHGAGGDRDAERGRRGGRAARRAAGRRAGDDVHGVAGPPADDPEHVQDRRELTPAVIHVAARSLAAQALSIFGDHSDVMARGQPVSRCCPRTRCRRRRISP